MILKIDHISFSCAEKDIVDSRIPKEYTLVFSEISLPNVDSKKDLLLNRENEKHNIFMFQGPADSIPIEITQYHTVTGQSKISCNKRDIFIPTFDIEETARFFMCFGMKRVGEADGDIILELAPFLDKQCFRVHLTESKIIQKPHLDISGYSSIGLFVDCIDGEAKKIQSAGYSFTGISPINVNGKMLKVAFSYGKHGEIVELIALGG